MDVKSNQRVHLPRTLDNEHEKELIARDILRNMTIDEYLKECGMEENVTESEKRGMEKLAKRVEEKVRKVSNHRVVHLYENG